MVERRLWYSYYLSQFKELLERLIFSHNGGVQIRMEITTVAWLQNNNITSGWHMNI